MADQGVPNLTPASNIPSLGGGALPLPSSGVGGGTTAAPQTIGEALSGPCCPTTGSGVAAAPSVLAFRRVIAQPADADSFVVLLPTPQANGNYKVTATLADATVLVIIAVPTASRTATQFVCITSAQLSTGDSIDFEVSP